MGSLEDLQKGDPEDFWAVAECPRLSRSPRFGRQLSESRPQVLPTCTISTCSKRMTTNVPCAWQPSELNRLSTVNFPYNLEKLITRLPIVVKSCLAI